ncbi:hypothetical protein [Christiangramia echinicola]|uniref:hypothetical protein n=1 Tax=Christiangramia echinicola TaxID=279359 RepID=UPI0003FD9485|nr:hypothetical protein [Christiangramia echinicola]
MLIIEEPRLEKNNDKAIISVQFELENQRNELWYSFPEKFEKFLVTEQADAFLIGLLFLGLKTGNDIKLNAPISSKLYYSLRHYLIDALCLVNKNYKKIRIIPSSLSLTDLNVGNTAGTGLSCGIDSLSTFYDHNDEVAPFKIDYFTFFNVGSHGDHGGNNARLVFKDRYKNVEAFAKKVNREVLTVDSNLSEILEMKFQETYNLRTISCALLFQKLFKNYYYSSGTRFDHYGFNNNEIADLDMLIIPNLSTESTSFFVSALKYSRVERTELISNFPDTYNHLDVCTHPYSMNREEINCSKCYKCQRTMLTLDLLGKLDLYSKVFNVQKFRKNRNNYIGWLLSKKKKLTLDRELINFIEETGEINWQVEFFKVKNIIYRKKTKLFQSLFK